MPQDHDRKLGALGSFLDAQLSPERTRAWRLGLFIVLAVTALLSLVINNHHPHFGVDAYPFFWTVFGLVVGVFLVFLVKKTAEGWRKLEGAIVVLRPFYEGLDDLLHEAPPFFLWALRFFYFSSRFAFSLFLFPPCVFFISPPAFFSPLPPLFFQEGGPPPGLVWQALPRITTSFRRK